MLTWTSASSMAKKALGHFMEIQRKINENSHRFHGAIVDLPVADAQCMVYLPTYTINLGPTVGKLFHKIEHLGT